MEKRLPPSPRWRAAAAGECWSSTHAPQTKAKRRQAISANGSIPPPDPALFGLTGEDAQWVARRQTPHPGGVYDDPLTFDAARLAALPRTFIDCNAPALSTIAGARRRVREQPGWKVLELATICLNIVDHAFRYFGG
jgi:hypothetical protein